MYPILPGNALEAAFWAGCDCKWELIALPGKKKHCVIKHHGFFPGEEMPGSIAPAT